jgi:hypothetical protein
MNERVVMTDRTPVPFLRKLDVLWWLQGPDGWTVPDVNNGAPYLPEVKNIWLRRFYWFFARNPLMNFAGFVLGVEDNNYIVEGPAPVLATTLRDAVPPRTGWKWAIIWPQFSIAAFFMALLFAALTWLVHWAFAIPFIFAALKVAGPLPYVSRNVVGGVEFYLGWRPHSGGFGFKLVWHKGEA